METWLNARYCLRIGLAGMPSMIVQGSMSLVTSVRLPITAPCTLRVAALKWPAADVS